MVEGPLLKIVDEGITKEKKTKESKGYQHVAFIPLTF